MKPMTKALIVAVAHVALVASLGGKLLVDRVTRQQAWFQAENYDPDPPIRGRYVNLQLRVKDPRSASETAQKFAGEIKNMESQKGHIANYEFGRECGSIKVVNGEPVAVFVENENAYSCENLSFLRRRSGDGSTLRLMEPVVYFIPDTAQDPTRLQRGDEMWVLATIPKKGRPRPVALGVKHAGANNIERLAIR